jgi:TM2 domain-containing membrane protein YozV
MEDSNMEGSRPRRPLYALLLTFGATGLGHIYCGRLVKGLVLFFITFLFTPVIVFSAKYVSSIFTLILSYHFFGFPLCLDRFMSSR